MKKDAYPTSRICSFEFMDIVIAEPPYRFNMHPIEKPAGGWAKIVDAIDLALCCDGLGDAILPGSESTSLCKNCKEVPTKKDYLAALVRCVNSLQGKHGGLPHVTQITDKLHWNRKPGTLFRDCVDICVRSNLQTLEERSCTSDPPAEDLRQCNGAVLFGKTTKLMKGYKVPHNAEGIPAEEVPAQDAPAQDVPAENVPAEPALVEPLPLALVPANRSDDDEPNTVWYDAPEALAI
jgi:hypothetical protein